MIKYQSSKSRSLCEYLFQLSTLRGSVLPAASKATIPCSLIALLLRWLMNEGHIDTVKLEALKDNVLWSGFSFLVGFLVIFRTSQSYQRFDAGCTHLMRMRAEWFDACSALIAFCKHSKMNEYIVLEFQHVCIRLFSMLHAAALAEIEDSNSKEIEDISAFAFPLIDPDGVDNLSLSVIKDSDTKVELLYQWIQQLVVENINSGVLDVPAPILTRTFQEMGSGMVALSEAIKISSIPLPFPYVQCCDLLLAMHWCLVPLVVTQWTAEPWWAFSFCFIQVFVLWSLNYIAVEIENPFGSDPNDIEAGTLQEEMNSFLSLLLRDSTKTTPRLSDRTRRALQVPGSGAHIGLRTFKSFKDAWIGMDRKRRRDYSVEDAANLRDWETERMSAGNTIISTVTSEKRSWQSDYSHAEVDASISIKHSKRKTVKMRPSGNKATNSVTAVLRAIVPAIKDRGSTAHQSTHTNSKGGKGKGVVIVPAEAMDSDSDKDYLADKQYVGTKHSKHNQDVPERQATEQKHSHFDRCSLPVETLETPSQQHNDTPEGKSLSSTAYSPAAQNAPTQAWFGVPKAPANRDAAGRPPDVEPQVLPVCDPCQDLG
mmetsp:Transcript_132354/g.247413  ORF Transcript_132354/g.247413 Transcript_132354/m.247413 type:complete len:597 (+) Transcript_132354:16-1806(+)